MFPITQNPLPRLLSLIPPALLLTGCDPLVSLQGSFWPPWIMVMVAALPMTAVAHQGLKLLGIADHITAPVIVYPALWALMTCIAWLIAFPW